MRFVWVLKNLKIKVIYVCLLVKKSE